MMHDWDAILDESERLAAQFRRLDVDLSEAEKAGNYYVVKACNDAEMRSYLELMARDTPPRSCRSKLYFRSLWDIWRNWRTDLSGVDKARAWGWGVRLAKAEGVVPPAPHLPKRPTAAPERPTVAPATHGRQRGTVKWFNDQQHFGFILPAGGGDDVFVHVSGLAAGVNTLLPGQQVEFEMKEDAQGRSQAANVRPVAQ